ncbi:MAG TPA: PQQ-binding-like beta-propeller repeat protein [Thermoanaerobaculia bacterium]
MRNLLLFIAVTLIATAAAGQMGGMQPVVASDGTVLVQRPALGLVAVSPAGVTRWTWDAGIAMHSITVSAERVLVVDNSARQGTPPMMGRGPATTSQEIVALSLATGAVQWRRDVAGMVSGITPAGDRLYVVTVSAGAIMHRGAGSGATTLLALDAASGVVLWSIELR